MRLAVMTYSLRSHVGKDLPVVELPKLLQERYGVGAMELWHMHVPGQDARRLDPLVEACREANVDIVGMALDVGDLSQPDPAKRTHDKAMIKAWLQVAAYLGAPAVRVNTGPHRPLPVPDDISVTIEGMREVTAFGRDIGVQVVVENHWGVSGDPANLVRLYKEVEGLGALPDFGNFDESIRYDGLKAMMPYAVGVHAKTYDFDKDGRVTQFDFDRCLQIVRAAGFDRYVAAEFEGQGDQYAGVAQTLNLLREGLDITEDGG